MEGPYIMPIKNGTVIDHLPAGMALKILRILTIGSNPVTLGIGVPSKKLKRKDLVFIEGKKLSKNEVDKIALLAKNATLNHIQDSRVVKKEKIVLPKYVEGVIQCINPNCITNHEEIATKFFIKEKPLQATCYYCETRMNEREIIKSIK